MLTLLDDFSTDEFAAGAYTVKAGATEGVSYFVAPGNLTTNGSDFGWLDPRAALPPHFSSVSVSATFNAADVAPEIFLVGFTDAPVTFPGLEDANGIMGGPADTSDFVAYWNDAAVTNDNVFASGRASLGGALFTVKLTLTASGLAVFEYGGVSKTIDINPDIVAAWSTRTLCPAVSTVLNNPEGVDGGVADFVVSWGYEIAVCGGGGGPPSTVVAGEGSVGAMLSHARIAGVQGW